MNWLISNFASSLGLASIMEKSAFNYANHLTVAQNSIFSAMRVIFGNCHHFGLLPISNLGYNFPNNRHRHSKIGILLVPIWPHPLVWKWLICVLVRLKENVLILELLAVIQTGPLGRKYYRCKIGKKIANAFFFVIFLNFLWTHVIHRSPKTKTIKIKKKFSKNY